MEIPYITRARISPVFPLSGQHASIQGVHCGKGAGSAAQGLSLRTSGLQFWQKINLCCFLFKILLMFSMTAQVLIIHPVYTVEIQFVVE